MSCVVLAASSACSLREAPPRETFRGATGASTLSTIATSERLLGRAEETDVLRALLAGARNGSSGAILVRGDPGVGKTTLIGSALDGVSAARVLRVAGHEVETTLPYGALQRLVGPLVDYVTEIPRSQREALRVAAGRAEGPPPQRALVGLGILSILARSGDDAPTICVVDDAHNLDGETLEVLGFVARRLSAESVAMIFAARDDENVARALGGVPILELAGLDPESAATVLREALVEDLDPTIVAEFVAYTAGNPLALRELGSQWSAQELTSAVIAHSPMPLGHRLEAHYSERVATLPPASRMWMLVAAAESAGDAAIVRSAASSMGLPDSASAEPEALGLVEVHDSVRFRHPLVRSAVYNRALDADRRAAHRALQVETAARGMREFAVWHAAAASPGLDANVAAELAAVADLAGARGGLASRARLLARAAGLAPDPRARSEWSVAAAEAAIGAGAGLLSRQLLAQADREVLDPIGRGRALVVEAMCAVYLADSAALRDGPAVLVAAADEFRGASPELERKALLFAMNSVLTVEDRAVGTTLDELARRMRSAAGDGDGNEEIALRSMSSLVLDDYEIAVPHLRAAVEMLDALGDDDLLEFSFFSVAPCIALWDCDAASRLLTRTVRIGRERGALREVDAALWILSAIELSRVNPGRAGHYLTQADGLRRALGYAAEQTVNPALFAWQDMPRPVLEQIVDAMREAGYGGVARMAVGALAINEIADGEYRSAFERLSPLVRNPYMQASFHHIPELVEAAVRSGNRDIARETAAQLDRYAAASGTAWANGLAHRAAALLADDDRAEPHFRASVMLLDAPTHRGDRARSRLLYGEWLRRMRRRSEAQEQLRSARDTFIDVGAHRFAERARRELVAAGAKLEEPTALPGALTAQEAEVARLAAHGATNADIGSVLFISSNTVDYHLRKVFRKLGITSRRQLADLLPSSAALDAGGTRQPDH